MLINPIKFIYITILLLIVTLPVVATSIQQRINGKSFIIPKLSHDVQINGSLDEKVWQQALVFDLNIETKPAENAEAPVKAKGYVFEDGESIYVAFRAYDPEPEKIRAHYHDHDHIFDDDVIGIKFDTFNDGLHAYQFFVNALGVKHDSIEDGVTKRDDMSWNTIWDAAAKITAEGYQVEMSIPLSILRFDDSKPQQTWGIDLLRFYPREVHHRISYHKVDRNISCSLCQNGTITGFKDVQTSKNLSIVPYMTAIQQEVREKPLTDDWTNSGAETDFGADIRWGISPDTTLNATINPDFSQVESDVAQLDINNNFSLFFPEKRDFFLEGADYYKSLMSLVHTRNISDPDYGMKVTHSSNGNNYGAFVANDTQTNYVLPGNTGSNLVNYQAESINGVFRYRRDLENTSSIGTLVTIREADNYHNYVYGIDGLYRFSDTDVLRAQVVGSDTEDPQGIIDEFSLSNQYSNGSAVDLQYRHEERDWEWWGRYHYFDEEFRTDLGFKPKVDYERYVTGVKRYWYADNEHWWNKLAVLVNFRINHDTDGQFLDKLAYTHFVYNGPLQSHAVIGTSTGEQYWEGKIYPYKNAYFEGQFTPTAGLVTGIYMEKEETLDYTNSQPGDALYISPSVTYNLGLHLQTELRYTHQKMDVAGGELFKTSLLNARLIYQFSVHSFLRLIVQYSDTDYNQSLYNDPIDANVKNFGTQLLYSYKFNPQTVFFLGYSDSAYEDDSFNKLEKTDKTLFMKMSYSWQR